MSKLKSLLIAILLSCQISLASAVEVFNVANDEIHQSIAHDQVIDHHHHDAFSTHLDHHNGESGHHHTSDYSQSVGLASESATFACANIADALRVSHAKEPSSVYLDGPLRPPRSRV
ncbi:hypothetical protein [Zwartia vadi]|uniref:hypothetical protein n=1 Tax=Zwartia vadi TaxID=3058168 RepID=UPI0025B3C623|nr:hypothetical protein [Zwartia vadi]MDN3986824.1 hypothetical protein [Zwartia vadi]